MKQPETQGRRLISMLKRRGMTTLEMLQTGISVAPWKRIAECLEPGERLLKKKDCRGLNVYRVTRETQG